MHPLAIATNFYGTDYSGLPVHDGRTIIQYILWKINIHLLIIVIEILALRAGLLTLTSASVCFLKLGLTSPEF